MSHPAGQAAYERLASFRAFFDEIAVAARENCGIDLSPVVAGTNAGAQWFSNTVHQQLGLLALGYASGCQLAEWGVTPTAMLGNSIGEYTTAALAGVWSARDTVTLVHERASAMLATLPGLMASVTGSAQEVLARLGAAPGAELAVSGPGRVVISGPEPEMTALLDSQALRGLDVTVLENRRAFHSATMDGAVGAVRRAAASVPWQRPAVPLVSNVTGQWIEPDAAGSPDYWARQVRQTVLLEAGITTLLGAGCDTFVELGPGTSMTSALRRHPDWRPGHATVSAFPRSGDQAEDALLRVLGFLWERGTDIPADVLAGPGRPSRCSLPGHPFDSRDPDPDGATSATADGEPLTSAEADAQVWLTVKARDAVGSSIRADLEALWCSALGVASAAASDDFYALGGESFMAVSLLAKAGDLAKRTISVAEFTARPTFGELVRLTDAGPVPARPAGAVLLRDGAGAPLFLAADATGSAASYLPLANAIDRGPPVYGLEPGPVTRRIEDIAAQHVEAVLGIQPTGPFTIGGWSFGAVVAHEMARQLTGRGENVRALVCLDGFALDRGRLPIATDPGTLVGALRLQAGVTFGTGALAGKLPPVPGIRRRFVASIGALLRYRPRPVPCKALVFKAGTDLRAAERLRRKVSGLYPGGVSLHLAAGDHWSMLAEPHVSGLAAELSQQLSVGLVTSGGTTSE